jgi:P27 family predicted phage terminase small subunit
MGKRGPKPEPSSLKRAKGNPGKRKLNDDEPLPPSGEIVPPRWMSKGARGVWDSTAPICIAMKTLTTADVLAFARHCENIARDLDIRKLLGRVGYTCESKSAKGDVVSINKRPELGELLQLQGIIAAGDDRFGLNPSSRSKIRVERKGPAEVAPEPPAAAGTFRDRYLRGPIPISKGA